MPITNQKVANDAASKASMKRRMNVQQMAKSDSPVGPSAVQQLGAQAAGEQAAGQTAALAQGAQTAVQNAQVDNQSQQIEQNRQNLQAKEAQQQKQLNRKNTLSQLDQSMSNELLDATMDLREQKANTVFNNERQMMDWAASQARSQEEFNNWAQESQQFSQKKIQMVEGAFKMARQALEFEYREADGERKREIQTQLDQINRAHEKAKRDAEKKAKKSSGLLSFATSAVTAAVGGALIYSGVGAPIGAAMVGSGISGMAGSAGDALG